ncbi:MAG: DNA repair protein RadC [Bacteroidales bacterium]
MKSAFAKGIKSLAMDDRPREKLLLRGPKALTEAELTAILIGSGTVNASALDIARHILGSVSHNLAELSLLGVAELIRFNGIGTARAVSLVAALELGRRQRLSEGLQKRVVGSSRDAFELIHPMIGNLIYEEFWILTLNRGNRIKRSICISQGSVAGTVADPKKIFKLALEDNASAVILCHNHPSGMVKPSSNDNLVTKKCKESGAFLDLPVLDHLIVAGERYFSYADEGLL